MASQAIWIGITVGVFFAGLGIGYAVFQSSPNSVTLTRQQMIDQMISDPQAMTDMMNQMMADPQAMQKMHEIMTNDPTHLKIMSDPQHMKEMHEIMAKNPEHMKAMMNDPQHAQQMMQVMMSDPTTTQQMHQMMFQDPQHMQQMMTMMMGNSQFMQGMMMNPQFQKNWMGPWMMNNTNWQGMMGPGSMWDSGMMGPGMMMGTPITKQSDILKTLDNIEGLLDQVSTKYAEGDSAAALSTATEAYLENYEYIEGAVASKNPDLMEKVELMLRKDLRHAISTDQPIEEIDSTIDSIKKALDDIRDLF